MGFLLPAPSPAAFLLVALLAAAAGLGTWATELPNLGAYDVAGDALVVGWQGLR